MMPKKITVIGLCGRSGSGKGYVCRSFAALGVPFIDTDAVYRSITETADSACLNELRREFGDRVADDCGLNRKVLSAIVFSDKSKLEKLNSVTHKYILEKTLELISEFEKNGGFAVIIDAPVLFESGFDAVCDICVCVTCDDKTRIKRITERDGITVNAAKARLSSQLSDSELKERCDFEIVNDGVRSITEQARAIIETIGEKPNET